MRRSSAGCRRSGGCGSSFAGRSTTEVTPGTVAHSGPFGSVLPADVVHVHDVLRDTIGLHIGEPCVTEHLLGLLLPPNLKREGLRAGTSVFTTVAHHGHR